MILYSRWEQGSKQISINIDGYSIEGKSFPSWKEALSHLGNIKYIPPSRYFRRDSKHLESLLFRDNISSELNKSVGKAHHSLSSFLVQPKGIDFSKKLSDIRKLVYSGFARKISGYDPEDVLQEVLQGLLIRNQGQCPFDSTKSSFGSYVHMVASCVISNYHHKNKKYSLMEEEKDFLSEESPDPLFEGSLKQFVLSKGEKSRNWERVFEMVLEGQKTIDIAEELGYSVNKVSKQTRKIKELSAEWAKNQGMLYMVPSKFIKE